MIAPAEPWIADLTIGAALRAVAGRQPDREALVFPQHGFRVTYAETDRLVDEAARGLLALGIGHGDKVAIWSTNRPEWVLLQLATARIGAVLVTVNPAFREDELRYVLQQSGARALFLTDRFKSSDYFARALAVLPEMATAEPGGLRAEAAPELRWVVALPEPGADGMLTWGAVLQRGDTDVGRAALAAAEPIPSPAEAINLQYTSGTTGFPKGALLSHRNLLLNAWHVGACQGFGPGDRVCSPVPLYHCFGCVVGVLGALTHGATLLVPADYFDATATLECLEQERATAVYGVPTMFIAELEDPSFAGRTFPSLRTGVMAGAPCPIEVMNRVIRDMGASEITIGYGLTESSPVATQTRPEDPVRLRVETVGRPIPGVEVSIRQPGAGAPLPTGQQGEICIRGHNVMLEYHRMPEATAAAIDAEGWLHSGDLGELDDAGYLRVTGRSKDMIIRGGENIYPREIEEALYGYAPVEDVEVVGVPDERLGEEVCAWIRLRPGAPATAGAVREYCRGSLAHYKVPRYVAFAESFPTTVSGKVQKFKLRQMAVERLAAGELDDALRHLQ